MTTTVSSVTSHFPSAEDGFTTTLSSTISAGATTVGLNSVAGYANGEVAVLVVAPTVSSEKQVFTGIVDTSGIQLTGVKWTTGTNQTHAAGTTVVDYATATHISMISKGILVSHEQDGTIKDGAITTAAKLASDVVTTAKILDDAVTAPKLVGIDRSNLTTDSNPYKFLAYQTGTAQTLANTSPTKVVLNTEAYDTNNNFDSTTNYRYTVPVSGFYQICVQFTPTAGANTAVDCYLYKNGSLYANSKMGNTGSVANASASINLLMQLTAADYLELYGACGSGSGTTLAGGGTVWNYMSGYLVSRT